MFPPSALSEGLGTVTALQVGPGTFAAPAGYCVSCGCALGVCSLTLPSIVVLYLSAPLLAPPSSSSDAASLLEPYLSSLLSLDTDTDTAISPLFTTFFFLSDSPSPPPPPSLPANMLVVPSLPSFGSTATMATSLDEAVEEAERLFWIIVGEEGRKEGVEFFARDLNAEEED